jgi:multimeric flavodoxin WrbA
MKVAVFTSSPNKDGLTAACGKAAMQGIKDAGGVAQHIDLNSLDIGRCAVCANGWGTCFKDHACQLKDDFQPTHSKIIDLDAYVIVSPVYWGEMSEPAKAFFDRLRRCEAFKEMLKGKSIMHGKPVIGIAAAGGSGNGTINCLESMERFYKQMGADIFDLIGVTRRSRAYKIETIRAACKEMVLNGSKEVSKPETYEQD